MMVCTLGGQPHIVRKHRNKGESFVSREGGDRHPLILDTYSNPKWLDEILEYCPGVKVRHPVSQTRSDTFFD